MIPLQSNRLILTWFCLFPCENDSSAFIKFAQRIFSLHCFILTCIGFCGSVLFVKRNLVIDLESSLFGVLQVAALINVIYMQILAHIHRTTIIATIKKFEEIYKSCKIMIHTKKWFFLKIFPKCND